VYQTADTLPHYPTVKAIQFGDAAQTQIKSLTSILHIKRR
jgi:hypothetical protein